MNTDKQECTPQATYFAEMVARHASLQGDTVFLELLRALVQSSDKGNSALDVRNWESPCREEALKRLEDRDSAWSCAVAEDGCEDMLHPLVWVSSTDCLYLLKNRLAEKQIAAYVASSLAKNAESSAVAPAEEIVAGLSTNLSSEDARDQRRAVASSFGRAISMITGGPGTGKTTTLGAVLALEIQKNPDIRIALAAPTGKAAAQMGTAIREQLDNSGLACNLENADMIRGKLGELRPVTIHKLLGINPQRMGLPRFHHKYTLPYDLVIVDESSMVSLLLFRQLVDAIPEDGRLMLLGDKDQLASVEPGAVFGDLAEILLKAEPSCYTWLRINFRSREIQELVGFASNIAEGRIDLAKAKASELYGEPEESKLLARELPARGEWEEALRAIKNQWNLKCPRNGTPEELLAFHESFKILCAVHQGPCGTEALNQLAAKTLGIGNGADGMPVLVTKNDPLTGLSNGNVGVWKDGRVWFRIQKKGTESSVVKGFAQAELPGCEPAFAITIHKSQGSSYDNVLVILPDSENQILSRNLVYTAVTRARKRCLIWGAKESILAALDAEARRVTGLPECAKEMEKGGN